MKNKIQSGISCKTCLAAGLLLYAIPGNLWALDWPSSRGNAANTGSSVETINVPLVEKWHSSAPDVEENGAVVANGVAYMCSENGQLYAFEVATGFAVPGFPVATAPGYGTPAVDTANGRVYVLAGNNLFGFTLSGATAPGFPVSVGFNGANYNVGPVIDGGFVYFNAGSNLRKLNSAGVQQWAAPTSANDTQPSVSGDYVYTYGGNQIQKYDKNSGTQIVGSGFPIVTSFSSSGIAVADGKIFAKSTKLYAFSTADGSTLWSADCGGDSTYYDSPAVAGGAVYVFGWDGKVYAFNANTGASLTGFPSVQLNPPFDRNWSSPAVASDKVFIGAGTSQKLVVLGAAGTAQAGQILDSHLTFSTDFQGFDLCSPVVSDGYVFAMLDGGGLYCFYGGGGPPPAGALQINANDPCTEQRDVILTLDNNNNPNVTQMRISEDPFFGGTAFQAYIDTIPFTLSAGFGTKTVYAQLKTATGELSNVFTDQIEYREICEFPCGDLNKDGKVDAADRALIQGAMRKTSASTGFIPEADYDKDGTITSNDYRLWYACYKAYLGL